MIVYEIGTGYTPIPARMGAATEIVVEELTRALIKKKLSAKIIDIATSDRLPTDLPIIEVNVLGCFKGTDEKLGLAHKMKRVVYSISLSKCLKDIIRKSEQKVVLHFHNQYNLFFFSKLTSKRLRDKCRIIYTNHSYVWHGDWSEIENTVKKRYFQEIECMKVADKVFVLNEIARENIIKHIGINKDKVALIDNGVNTSIYSPASTKEAILKKYKLEGKKVFIQVGSVCDRKNQLGAIRLLLPIMKDDKNIVFCYAGGIIDSEYKEKIDKFAREEGISDRIRYFGEIKPGVELNEFYNIGEAMVFPSKAEGFSLVILEAMSAGIPVIISEKLEFKLSDECLKYKDEKDFRHIVNEMILDIESRSRLSGRCRKIIEDSYSWEAIADEYYKACED
ncbi:MAG: glycosyltransferase family 4 protein [Oribacterium sp.]|nr:glycosyltransferase family 4 protein [Oribacterium sp.]